MKHANTCLSLLCSVLLISLVRSDDPVVDDGYNELCSADKAYRCKCPSNGTNVREDEEKSANTLDCSNRGLTNMSIYGEFIDQIETVNFRNNIIKYIFQNTIVKGRNVRTVDLSHNYIEDIAHSVFSSLKSLRKLILSHNSIWSLDNTFDGLENLEILDLSYNQIMSWESAVFKSCKNLKDLYVRNNPFGSNGLGSDAFQFLPSLEKLSLENTGVTELSELIFRNNYNLKYLYLSGNMFMTVPNSALQRAQSLRFLDMSHTQLKTIQYQDFEQLTQLNELHLDRIKELESIEKNAFQDLKKLKTFHCKYNYKLNQIDSKAFTDNSTGEVIAIESLFLRSNSLQHLSSKMLNWNTLRNADFEGNPWRCDCNLKWIVEYHIKGLTIETKCSKPKRISGQAIKSLSASDFVCTSFLDGDSFLISVLIFMMIATISVTGIAFLFMHNCCVNRLRRYIPLRKEKVYYSKVVANKERVDLEWDHSAEP